SCRPSPVGWQPPEAVDTLSQWAAAFSTWSVVRPGWASPCWLSGSCRLRGSRGCPPMWYARCCAGSCPGSMPPTRTRSTQRSSPNTCTPISNKWPRCAPRRPSDSIEGFELSPSYPGRLEAALEGTRVRACFLGHSTFSADGLAFYRGPKPQHEGEASRAELTEAAAWIRDRSNQLRDECREEGLPYVDVGAVGFEAAMQQARRHLLRRD